MRARATTFQQRLLDELPEGFSLFRGMIGPGEQLRLVELARAAARSAPLIQPRTRYGTPFHLKITSWGRWGWLSDEEGYHYEPVHPVTRKPWPEIPGEVKSLMSSASRDAGFPGFDLQTVLINFYSKDAGRLGLHQDKTEKNFESPIVTASLGDSCIFGVGGAERSDPVQEVVLDSGDVLVQGGPARLNYHEVIRILPGTSKLLKRGGRISLTGRAYV
jgi:alkylated DNA repair protein (DNA oxidative demethylase)